MIKIRRYTPADKPKWDAFVTSSKNATFLHFRDYMDYHADRFTDFSLMAYEKEEHLIAILPANISGSALYSHQGLTYGSWLTTVKHVNANTMLEIFEAMITFLRENGITRLIYKAIPHIFHKYPAEEDLYALFRFGARISAVNMSSVVELGKNQAPFDRRARRTVAKAKECGITLAPSSDYASFWKILSDNLMEKYGTNPVHSLKEIELLQSRFPSAIRLYMAYSAGTPVAGAVIFESDDTVHAQYSSANRTGNECGALGYLFSWLITETYRDRKYFDFGTSNEDEGRFLNKNLIEMKSGYGARGVAFSIYELDI